ncbi:MAG: TonB-dependent receptor [Henriciella sp.]|nr:TonB-dependent receptor [Henriciella sp.]
MTNKLMMGVACVSLLTSAGAAYAQDTAEETEASVQERIVVTAQRRAESIQDVPVSVTAFTGPDLADRGVSGTLDIAAQVPGFVAKEGTGTYSAAVFHIRGIGQQSLFNTLEPGVGFYIDDVYIPRTVFGARSVFDLDRVEVLRGPQGTLYGRNSTGGALKLYSQTPDPDAAGGRIEAFGGDYERYELGGSANVPIGPNTAFNVSAQVTGQGEGFMDNTALEEDVNKSDSQGFRAALLHDFENGAQLVLRADYAALEADGKYNSVLDDNVTSIDGVPTPTTSFDESLLDETNSPLPLINDSDESGFSATFELPTAFGSFTSITAFRTYDSFLDLDLNNGGVRLAVDMDGESFSQEFKLEGSARPNLDWIAGLFYFDEVSNQDFIVDLPLVPLGLQDTRNKQNATSIAGYGQLDWSVSEQLSVSAGLRYTSEEKDITVTSFGVGGAPTYSTSDVVALGLPVDLSFDELTPHFGAQFEVSDTLLSYGSYTRGYKAGGFNSTVAAAEDFLTFEPEYVDAFEIGVKGEYLDRRLVLNAALFHNMYTDIQFDQLTEAGTVVTGNVGEATISGLELETDFRVNDQFRVFGFAALMDSEIEELEQEAIDAGISVGNELINTPDFSGQIGAEFTQPVSAGAVMFQASANYQAEHWNNPQNTPLARIPERTIVNSVVRFTPEDGGWFVQAECQNCFDERTYDARLSVASGYVVQPIDPATWGVRVGYDF